MKYHVRRILKGIGWSLLTCFILFQVYVAIRLYLVASCAIPTYSMSPTLLAGDYIITTLQIPGRRILKNDNTREGHYIVERKEGMRGVCKGDILVFNYPYSRGEEQMLLTFDQFFCKRCAGIPGETYRWRWEGGADSIYLPRCGEMLLIDTLNLRHYRRCIEYETGQMPEVKQGMVVHADTMMRSYRFTGNYYFMLGDNYGDSYDSRFWGILNEDFILGVGLFTWFSKDPDTGNIRWKRMFKEL